MKKTSTGLFLFFTCSTLNSQISVTVTYAQQEPVVVILKTAQGISIVAFTQTDKPVFI
ncbi:hypothetical protein [uncultured Nonlabens sp.]|uniref:hypothetical protein n=1 Tax=uncultured Nonlabens sp. TaxID=859306 RepID=UPI00260632BD|nr:hypothetical protein [uncultured Nonlabens sp.]